ncbi:hypothetical protein NPIL_657941 [Nephila pilipes]|uniref:Uncharacterized protein n=1 Tax=Nephila pilipes TaxID=299642 RepID=A0A8X6PAL4_NEPPI|nr:hypothetical protein NPIL_657941 [Nephila pilipes]
MRKLLLAGKTAYAIFTARIAEKLNYTLSPAAACTQQKAKKMTACEKHLAVSKGRFRAQQAVTQQREHASVRARTLPPFILLARLPRHCCRRTLPCPAGETKAMKTESIIY